MDRRSYLLAASCWATSLAGCLSVSVGEDEDEPEPDPIVAEVRVPAVEPVGDGPHFASIDADSAAEPTFAATFENTGDAGEAAVSLTLLEESDANEGVFTAPTADRIQSVFFEAGERRTVTFEDVAWEGHGAYAIRARIGRVETDVRNDGDAGPVAVEIETHGVVPEERQVFDLDAGETETVSFEGAFLGDSIDVVATPAEDA